MHIEGEEISIFDTKPRVVYSGFWRRFAAAFIDAIIVGIPFSIIQRMVGTQEFINTFYLTRSFEAITFATVAYSIFSIIARWLYFAILESGKMQATIGKLALGIIVTDESGERISFGRATGRHFGKYISTIILFFGFFMMLWDDRNQTLHDKMAGTLVIKKDSQNTNY
jgi:uncharacterized RDD family membrane protein YckC